MRLSLPLSSSGNLAWLPVLAVGALVGWGDLHQTDTGVTAGLLLLLACFFTVGTRLPWWGVGLAISAFVPVFGLMAAALHWRVSGVEHDAVVHWTPTMIQGAESILALGFGLSGAALGLALRRLHWK